MIRAVLDTNVLLAALRSRNGASHAVLTCLARREFSMVIGNTILSEYDEVLKREGPAFGLTVTMVDQFLDALCVEAEAFQTSAFWKPFLSDADDEAFGQVALEAKVGYLVTHNRRHFPQEQLTAVKVVSPAEFLQHLPSIQP